MNTSALAPGLARKVKKILEIKTENPELLAALSTLSCIYPDNTPAARRQLRARVEERGLTINQQFLQAAETVTQALDDVQAQLDVLSGSCGAISAALASARVTASGLLSDADKAGRQLALLEAKAGIVEEYLVKYQLTPQEVAVLQGGSVGPEFFAALARVRAIHEHCKGLLRSAHQRAGLELMDQMSGHQEAAYEHLCRWVQAECRNLGEHDAPEVDPTLAAAVAALRDRPVLYKYCAEEVASARNGALFQRFILALTRGGPGGLPRPMEMHAHDPPRYVADMLAWVHQALCGEQEFVVSLFGDAHPVEQQQQGANPQQQQQQQQSGGGVDALSAPALLDRIFESVCRPLKVRIEQVLMMSPPLLLCFQLGQLTAFYHGLLSDILGPRAALSQAVEACRDTAHRTFMEQLKASGDRLLRGAAAAPPDLTPPAQVAQTLQLLSDIMTAYEGSLQASGPTTQQQQQQAPPGEQQQQQQQDAGVAGVLGAVLEPLVEMVKRSAEALSPDSPARLDDGGRLDPTAYRVYSINCLAAAQGALARRPAAAAWSQRLTEAIDSHLDGLISLEVGRLLKRSSLAEVVERVRLYKASASISQAQPLAPLASDPALSLEALCEALRRFFVAVSSPDALPEFGGIQSPRLRGDAVARVASSLVSAYEAVYQLLDDPTAGYVEQGGSGAVKHTPAQVRTILGVL